MKKAKLIILGGFAGAGKTTVAKNISARYNLPLVSTDELNDILREALALDFHACSPFAHETAWSLVRTYLKNGVTVMLDTNMCSDRTWQNLDTLQIQMPDVEALPIILECPLETHRMRTARRGETEPTHLNLGGDDFESVVHKYEYIKKLQRSDLVRVDADQPLETVCDKVLQEIKRIVPLSDH